MAGQSEADTAAVDIQDYNDSQLKIRNMRAQLNFVLNENESLREEIDELRKQLDRTQSAM